VEWKGDANAWRHFWRRCYRSPDGDADPRTAENAQFRKRIMTQHSKIDIEEVAARFLRKKTSEISGSERRVLASAVAREPLASNANDKFDEDSTLGQRLADTVARFGGSWTFLIVFGALLLAWISLNLMLVGHAIDPYPFVFLNLILSMVAAMQAPIIMMSQNRQSAKDRIVANHDYEVNLKAEIGIMALHDKFDQMRTQELKDLIDQQRQQIALLTQMMETAGYLKKT
jgi:uncharacterized membrane protein